MRQITKDAIAHFETASEFERSNTKVIVLPNVTILTLFDNPIAYRYNDPKRTLSITNAGWFSNATKERLNGIKGVSVCQIKGNWYLNGNEWNGKLIDINL